MQSWGKEVANRVFQEMIGAYTFDLDRTSLGIYQEKIYEDLQISFYRDSTFKLNRSVPFIYDSLGRWIPTKGGLEDWNWLYYDSNPKISTQFTEVLTTIPFFILIAAHLRRQ